MVIVQSSSIFFGRLIQERPKIACGYSAGRERSSDCYFRKIVSVVFDTQRGKRQFEASFSWWCHIPLESETSNKAASTRRSEAPVYQGLIRDEATPSVPLHLGMKHLLIAQESGLEPLKQTLSCPSSLSAESAEVFFLVAFCLCQESQIRSFRNGTISPRILTSFPLKARLPDLGCISNKTAMINEQIQMRLNWEITNVNAGTQED